MRFLIGVSAFALLFFVIGMEVAYADQTVTLKLVDQGGEEIVGSRILVGGVTYDTGDQVTLAETTHTFTLRPGVRGDARSALERTESVTVGATTDTLEFVWKTADVIFHLQDHNDATITGSRFRLLGFPSAAGFVTGTTVALPILDDTVYDSITGSQADGYDLGMYPGVNGAYLGSARLSRTTTFDVDLSTSSVVRAWTTASVTLRLVDQSDALIAGSQFSVDGAKWYWIQNNATITLPITDESTYPTLAGTQSDGYDYSFYPGMDGVYRGSARLGRTADTPLEVEADGETVEHSWITAPVTLQLVDQHDDLIIGSRFGLTGIRWTQILNNTTITLPITNETTYPTMSGNQMDGYDFKFYPGIEGVYRGGAKLARTGVAFEVDTGGRTITETWITSDVQLRLEDQSGDLIDGSKFFLTEMAWGNISNGATLTFPITDESVYTNMEGVLVDGIDANVYPAVRGVYPGGTHLHRKTDFEVHSDTTHTTMEWKVVYCPMQLRDNDNAPVSGSTLDFPTGHGYPLVTPGDVLSLPVNDSDTYTLYGDWVDAYPAKITPGDLPSTTTSTIDFSLSYCCGFDPASFTIGGNTYKLVCGGYEPTVSAFGSGTYEIGDDNDVVLSGEVADLDGDVLTWQWFDGTTALSDEETVTASSDGSATTLDDVTIGTQDLGKGTHTLTLKVDDGEFEVSATVTVEIIDTTAPLMAPEVSPGILWPPNHKMVEVEIDTNVVDNSGGSVTLSVEIEGSEDDNSNGDGNTTDDYEVESINSTTGIVVVNLRAERKGGGDGRTYTVTITAEDESGNTSIVEVEVVAPHDKGK